MNKLTNAEKFLLGYLILVFIPCVIAGAISAKVGRSCGSMEETVDYMPSHCYYIYKEEYLNAKLKRVTYE